MAEGPLQRATCARCKRPACVCYCSSFPAKLLRTERTHVLVLQHKHETHRRAAISSVPVLTQTLANVRLVTVDDDCDCSPGVSDDLDECLYNGGDATIDAAFVLFPDDRAQPLESTCDKAKSIGESKRVLLIVIDGTWREAKKIARRNRQVWEQAARSWEARGASFHYVCLGNEERIDGARARRSIYGDLRREPMEGCMSTLEAVASALYVLEPREIRQILHDSLLRAFKAKVSIQERYQEQGRVAKLKQYGGISKAKAVEMKRLERQQQQLQVKVEPRTDLQHRQQLLQQGEVVTCTYDEARDHCVELNRDRKRGQRIAMLPLDAFQREVSTVTQSYIDARKSKE